MMNTKANAGLFFFIFFVIIIVVAGVILVIALIGEKVPPTVDDPPPLEVLNPSDCLDKKENLLSFIDAKCTLKIKNSNQYYPIQLQPKFKCWKLSKTYNPKYIDAEEKAIIAGGTEEFTVRYENNGREWNCVIDDFNAMPIPQTTKE